LTTQFGTDITEIPKMKSNATPSPDMKRFIIGPTALAAAALLAMFGSINVSHAKDAIQGTVTPLLNDGDLAPLVTQNGAGLTPGTYAIGTVKLDYFVSGFSFLAEVGRFELCLTGKAASSRPATAYPATVNLRQVGSSSLVLGLSSDSVTFSGPEEEHCVDVTVSVPASVADDPAFQEDGTELVANLQLSTPSGTHLDTVTTFKVHATLLHPVACIRPIHLVSNHDFSSNLSDNGIAIDFKRGQRTLSSSPIDLQHVMALVNICDFPVAVDIGTTINGNFDLFQSNAVRTTSTTQQFADDSALLDYGMSWDDLQNTSATMCLENVSLPSNQAFVLAQRVRISAAGDFPGAHAASIGRATAGWSYDGFSYTAFAPGNACMGGSSHEVMPNSGEVSVPVNQVTLTQGGSPVTELPQ
jgi:hypothetical protein